MTLREKITLTQKIAQLEQFTKTLLRLQKEVTRKKFFSEDFIRKAIERYLQLALEAALDIAERIIVEEGLKKPEEYRDVILTLGEAKILPADFARRFSLAAGFRNILVHEYVRLDDKKVYEHFTHDAKDIKIFLRHIAKYLRR